MHASREGTGVPREKHKTRGQRKKAAHTLSEPETTRKRSETVSSSETYPTGTGGKRSGLYALGCLELDV